MWRFGSLTEQTPAECSQGVRSKQHLDALEKHKEEDNGDRKRHAADIRPARPKAVLAIANDEQGEEVSFDVRRFNDKGESYLEVRCC